MHYPYEYKRNAVELYRQGKWPETPSWVTNTKNFHDMIVRWYWIEEKSGPESLRHGSNKLWPPEAKLNLVSRVLAGEPISQVAYDSGINSGQLYQWVRNYKIYGYNGLIPRKKGRKSKNLDMKKVSAKNPSKLNESEYEELIRLRARTAFLEAENEVIKKEIALREEREAARLKAKKQQSSKDLEKKDIN